MIEAYFNNIRKVILERLNEAQEEVLIAMAWFTSAELFDELINCRKRGIQVKLILLDDAINWHPYAPDFNQLITEGGNIKIAGNDVGFLHHKFCVIDRRTVVTGSYNWTYYAEVRNIENVVVSDNLALVSQYVDEYNRLAQIMVSTAECKRLTWSDLETESGIDFSELNVEIEEISKVRNLPKHNVLQAQVKVELIEKERQVYSNTDVGISVYNNALHSESLQPLITKGIKLPCLPITKTFYNPIEKREGVSLRLYTNNCKDEGHLLLNEPLSKIVGDSKEEDLKITITASLDTNGYLRVVAKCEETGKSLDVTTTDSRLVRNE